MEWFTDYARRHGLKPDETGADEAAFICKVLYLKRGERVLDAPCGAGRISAPLARVGLRVTGVDLMPSYIQRARMRFCQEGLNGDFAIRDLREMDFAGQFDAAFNWQGSFGFFSAHENLDLVRRYSRCLRPGGRLLIDQRGREHLLRHFRRGGSDGDVEFKTRWESRSQRVITLFSNRTTGQTWQMSIRMYTPTQFTALFRQAGLAVEALYGDLAGTPYRRGARRIYVVGRKTS